MIRRMIKRMRPPIPIYMASLPVVFSLGNVTIAGGAKFRRSAAGDGCRTLCLDRAGPTARQLDAGDTLGVHLGAIAYRCAHLRGTFGADGGVLHLQSGGI